MSQIREINTHKVDNDEPIRIFATGERSPGNAQNDYVIGEVIEETITNCLGVVSFQKGNPATEGHNGVTMEALLAVCLDRLHCFQCGPYPSQHNEIAAMNIERAIEALKDRAREQKEITKARINEMEPTK
ncbi:hypothetical protein [Vibrio parahaemolyticus]|uniref:hypothetical protein n=1 Tax=Vibrio parahaemolyticus TaxID=670 RepID=UPI000D52F2FC|nr:hypothetical protein [Vibrio parahaemolyticus]AWG87368.1 unknow [Vibrio parahaemolyticus]